MRNLGLFCATLLISAMTIFEAYPLPHGWGDTTDIERDERFSGSSRLFRTMTTATREAVRDSLMVYIPSEVGGAEGLFTLILFPNQPRYGERGAPVVVHLPGGWDAEGVAGASQRWNLDGFIEVSFNFPGGGRPGQKSGGVYDLRGELCARAARDMLRFAMGKVSEKSGRFLHQLSSWTTPLYNNVGLCGWSNGGNLAITTAGAFGAELQGLAWIVNWESPVGDGMPNVECGSKNETNPAYNPNTGEFDLTMLAYSDTVAVIDVDRNLIHQGGVFFDVNGNLVYDHQQDFLLIPKFYRDRAYYSQLVTLAAFMRGLYPSLRPAHLTPVEQTQAFWLYRNGENWIPAVVQAHPELLFLVEAGVQDHVQGALDHPHVLIQYEGFRRAGARFVRLNPDRSYVEMITGMSKPMAADNDALRPFDHISIRSALEPRGPNGVHSTIGMAAAVCELADRTQYGILTPQLDRVITTVTEKQSPIYDCVLEQNYPNPFNGETVIRFHLATPARTVLHIFDINGRKVEERINGMMPSGRHEIVFDGLKHSNGVYFILLQVESNMHIKKMLLIK